jgi:CPA1 family monovalent cation:H+ antiporter
MRSVETVSFLVVVATVVATFARRLRIPAPSLLVVAGVVVGLLPGVPHIQVTPDIVSFVVLPPLLDAAGAELPWRDLRAVWKPVTALAVGLVLASAAVVAAVVVAITGLPIGLALVLGTVLASTDPVAVTALGRRLSLPPRLQVLIQAESLFNDATSLLLFRVAVSLAITTGGLSVGSTIGEFVLLAGGGAIVGAVVAGGVILIRKRTVDPVLETVISLVTPYAAYVLAEALHASGVTAVVLCSVVVGAKTDGLTNARIRLQLTAVTETVVFLLESVVFGLIGLELPTLIRELTSTDSLWPFQALAIAAALVVIRVLWVFPLSAIRQRRGGARPSWQVPAVVSWAGARGVVPLAAALTIPLTTEDGVALPHRDLVLLLASAVIVITLVVQGFTLAPLVKRAGVAVDPADVKQETVLARRELTGAGLAHLDHLADLETTSEALLEQLRNRLRARLERLGESDTDEQDTASATALYRTLRHDLLAVQSLELARLYESGRISDATRRRVQRDLDLEEAGLGEDG